MNNISISKFRFWGQEWEVEGCWGSTQKNKSNMFNLLVESFGTWVTLPYPNDFLLPHEPGRPTLVHTLLGFYLPYFSEVIFTEGLLKHTTLPRSNLKLSFHVASYFEYCILIRTLLGGVVKHLSTEAKLCDFESGCSWNSWEVIVTWRGEPEWTLYSIFSPFSLKCKVVVWQMLLLCSD